MRPKKWNSIKISQVNDPKLYKHLYYELAVMPYRQKKPLQMKDRVRCPCCGMLSTPEKLKKFDAEPLEYFLQELRSGFKHHRAEHIADPTLISEKLTEIGKKISEKMLFFSLKFMNLDEIKAFLNIQDDPTTLVAPTNFKSNTGQVAELEAQSEGGLILSPNYEGG